jgi:hypothetical protein
MKKIINILFFILSTNSFFYGKLKLVDKGEIAIFSSENVIIPNSDSTYKLGLDGKNQTFEELINWEIIFIQLNEDKIPVDGNNIEKYIEYFKQSNNLTDDDLINLFSEAGMTYNEGINQLNNNYKRNIFIQTKFRSNVFVTDEEVENYYNENPEYTESWFEIEIAKIDYDVDNKENIDNQLNLYLNGSEKPKFVEWNSIGKIYKNQIDEEKNFILNLNLNEIYKTDNKNYFELFRVINKEEEKIIDFESRKSSIIEILNHNFFEELLKKYNKEMKEKIEIINLK